MHRFATRKNRYKYPHLFDLVFSGFWKNFPKPFLTIFGKFFQKKPPKRRLYSSMIFAISPFRSCTDQPNGSGNNILARGSMKSKSVVKAPSITIKDFFGSMYG